MFFAIINFCTPSSKNEPPLRGSAPLPKKSEPLGGASIKICAQIQKSRYPFGYLLFCIFVGVVLLDDPLEMLRILRKLRKEADCCYRDVEDSVPYVSLHL